MTNLKQRLEVMIIAGEPSGDERGAELVASLREQLRAQGAEFAPRFFGAGGPALQAAGVELKVNMMELAVVGLSEVIKNFRRFQAVFAQLLKEAAARQPDLIICIDFSGFNRRFATAIRKLTAGRRGPFANWQPKIVQFVSPQVWASRRLSNGQRPRLADLDLSVRKSLVRPTSPPTRGGICRPSLDGPASGGRGGCRKGPTAFGAPASGQPEG
jgi:lipid-A-disaccharide synthase